MKKGLLIALCLLIILAGTGCVLYPLVSNYLYETRQDTIITEFQDAIGELDTTEKEAALAMAAEYNSTLLNSTAILTDPFRLSDYELDDERYQSTLNPNGDSIMGYVEVPKISIKLPIYHGTEENTLEKGVGHLLNSSLPVGGEGTHTVLTGHTGLSGKRIFTDLTKMQEGDLFLLHILGDTLVYEVDQIAVVLPYETELLRIQRGKDYATLLTCTPFGINDHRLLVRGKRIPYQPEVLEKIEETQKEETAQESKWMEEYLHALAVGFLCVSGVILLLLLIGNFIIRKMEG